MKGFTAATHISVFISASLLLRNSGLVDVPPLVRRRGMQVTRFSQLIHHCE